MFAVYDAKYKTEKDKKKSNFIHRNFYTKEIANIASSSYEMQILFPKHPT